MTLLLRIAHDMVQEAKRRGESQRELARGLVMQLVWVGGQKALRLSRPVVKPGDKELEICIAAFAVPAEADRQDDDNSVTFRWPSET